MCSVGNALFKRDTKLDAHFVGDGLRLAHPVGSNLACVSRCWKKSTRVEWVGELMGLKVRLPQSLSQISEQIVALRAKITMSCGPDLPPLLP